MIYDEYEQQSILFYTYLVNKLEQILGKQSIKQISNKNDQEEIELEDLLDSKNEDDTDKESECWNPAYELKEADEDTASEENGYWRNPRYCAVLNVTKAYLNFCCY